MTVADILDRAADLIEPEGMWGQGCGGPHAGVECAETAIFKIACDNGADDHEREAAATAFAKFVGGNDQRDIWKWNDAPERTQAEVVSKLREAAAKARGEPA